jgi:nucleoside-diphosphate-sugar epimerase
VGSGIPTSIGELAAIAADLAGAPGFEAAEDMESRTEDVTRLVAATEQARTLLEWAASTSLKCGLRQTLDYMSVHQ